MSDEANVFGDSDPYAYIKELEQQGQEQHQQAMEQSAANPSFYNSIADQNLVQWQLDLKEDMDRIYHLLKGSELVKNEDGDMVYIDPKDEKLSIFNNLGVKLIMNILSFYLNRNTLLSNYDLDTINWKVLDFGRRLNNLIYCKYQEMGLNTPEKMKLYPMIVQEIIDTIHSAYLRALKGGERESLRKAMHITESMTPLSSRRPEAIPHNKQRLSMNPRTWFQR